MYFERQHFNRRTYLEQLYAAAPFEFVQDLAAEAFDLHRHL